MLRNSPYLLLILATCIWGGNFVAGKALVTLMPPITLAAVRWTIAFLCLCPIFGKEAWSMRAELLRNWRMVLFLSVSGVAGFNTITYIAVQYTGSINAALMNSTTPIMVLLLTWLVIKEKIAWSAIPGILISMAGVLWIIGRGSLEVVLGLTVNEGDLWMLLAILLWAAYSVAMKKMAGRLPASPLLLVQVAVALALLLPLSGAELAFSASEIAWSPSLVTGLLYVGVFASIVAFLSWNRAIELAGPGRCAGFLNLIPLFSAIFATLFTGETIQLYHFLGAAFILTGVFMTNHTLKKRQRPQSASAK